MPDIERHIHHHHHHHHHDRAGTVAIIILWVGLILTALTAFILFTDPIL